MNLTLGIALGLAIALPGQWLCVRKYPHLAEWWYGAWMVSCVVLAAFDFAQGAYVWGFLMIACAVIDGISWWKHRKRRKRKRAAALLGEKSRALIAKLVHRQREATQGAS